MAGVAVALAGLVVQVAGIGKGDSQADPTPSPTATADPSSLPIPRLVHQTVEDNKLLGEGTTEPLPDDYTVYLQALRLGTNRANVSDPASIDEQWNWSATVELPSGDYAVTAVPGPTSRRSSEEFVALTGHQSDGSARLTEDEIRVALTKRTRWTEAYASDPVAVTVP